MEVSPQPTIVKKTSRNENSNLYRLLEKCMTGQINKAGVIEAVIANWNTTRCFPEIHPHNASSYTVRLAVEILLFVLNVVKTHYLKTDTLNHRR